VSKGSLTRDVNQETELGKETDLLTVGETLRVHFNLIAGTGTRWCGILIIYIVVAVLPAVLKVLLDDAFGTDDY
jgi:hypothetical protein